MLSSTLYSRKGTPTDGAPSAQARSLARTPLFLQVSNLVIEGIASGVWRPGSALPNEQDLARELGVSAGTVRKALDKLEAERLLVRKQGRGTFVADHSKEDSAGRFCKIRDIEGSTMGNEAALLEQTVGSATAAEQNRLQLDASEPVLRTRRMRLHRGRPFMLEEASLVMSRFPGVESNVGAYNICGLAQTHGVLLAQASESICLAEVTPEIAELLSVRCRTPLLRLDRVIFSVKGSPVEWRVGMCSPDQTYYLAEIN